MRFFEIEGVGTPLYRGPLRVTKEVVGEGNLENPISARPYEGDPTITYVTEAEMLAMDGGSEALARWRTCDDSAHEQVVIDELTIGALDDELEGRR